MLRYICALALIVATPGAPAGAADRPELFGFAPAYPDNDQFLSAAEGRHPNVPNTRQIEMLLEIDAGGSLTAVTAADPSDSMFAPFAYENLRKLSFEPARRRGQALSSRLPVYLHLQGTGGFFDVDFPLSDEGEVAHRDLYFRTFEANEIHPAKLNRFPAYFASLEWNDTLGLYPYVLLRLEVSDQGRVTAVDTVAASAGLAMTTASASLWAAYEPAVVDDRPVASDAFLAVFYFPQIMYPTAPWTPERADTSGPLEAGRVELLPDTVGIMAPPMPRRLPGNVFNVPRRTLLLPRTVTGILSVDTTGRASLMVRDKASAAHTQVVHRLVRQMSLYPARDYAGRPVAFRGRVQFVFDGSEKVRIRYLW